MNKIMEVEFKVETRDKLFPFMKDAFKETMEPSLVTDIDDLLAEHPEAVQLRKESTATQRRLDLGI